MLIYRGRGGLIALIVFLSLMAMELFTRARFHDDNYFQQHGWPRLAGFLMATLLVGWLTPPASVKRRVQPTQPEWLVSSSSNAPSPLAPQPAAPRRSPWRPQLFRPTDTLFYIPARWWPPILCLLGVLFALAPVDTF